MRYITVVIPMIRKQGGSAEEVVIERHRQVYPAYSSSTRGTRAFWTPTVFEDVALKVICCSTQI